ncbi:glycosyltransferase family 1 protein [Haladaptatus sp. T7]|uniref:glycosyltransferase family 4 protein n=1 Tax=Haladaptatus sp. T7 TaxID=2029368 RepID=UPI00222E13D0|nr:glycosyltransferase family 1 protein [Haladaptatus sp. T7]
MQATEYYIDKKEVELIRRGYDGSEKKIQVPLGIHYSCGFLSRLDDRTSRLAAIFSLSRFIPDSYDVYHIADQNMASLAYYDTFSPAVVTIHDLVWLTRPTGPIDQVLGRILFHGIKTADNLIAISEFTKKDLLQLYPSAQGKTSLVYNGVDQQYRDVSDKEITEIRNKYDLNKNTRYLLHLGTDKPTKNIGTLLDIIKKLPDDVNLVRTKPLQNSESYSNALDISNKINNIGFVPHEDLPALYAAVDIYINTSRYEGFGLPPLEAMAVGTPVVTSNAASLPEVVGNAGILCNPEDTKKYVRKINNIFTDPDLRNRLKDKSRKRARSFSWESCGEETLAVYKSAINKTKPSN